MNPVTDIEIFLSRKETSETLSNTIKVAFEGGKKNKGTITAAINDSVHYQEILGIGYSFEHTSCYNIMQFPEPERCKVIELLVHPERGAGMNLWRLCIGTPDFTYEFYTYDDMPDGEKDPGLEHFSIEKDKEFVIPVVKRALEINPDILFFASPWSPPGWMKGPEKRLRKGKVPAEGGKGMCSGRLLPEYYDVYAEYLVRYVEAYKAEGIPIHAITVQNEPHHNWYAMPTCYWRAEEERDFIKNHLGPKLEGRGLDTKIWCWDHNFGTLTPAKYPATVLSDPGAARHVDGIAFHHYSGFPKFMGKLKQRFPDKHVYFTEGSLLWLWGATRLSTYFRNWARCYTGWVPVISYPRGLPNLGPFKTTRTMVQRSDGGMDKTFTYPENAVLIRFDYYIMAHFSKFIKRGAKRIQSSARTPWLTSEVSFLNPDGTIVSIITNRRRQPITVLVCWRERQAMLEIPPRSIITARWHS